MPSALICRLPDVIEVRSDIAEMSRLLFRLEPEQSATLLVLAEHVAGRITLSGDTSARVQSQTRHL